MKNNWKCLRRKHRIREEKYHSNYNALRGLTDYFKKNTQLIMLMKLR